MSAIRKPIPGPAQYTEEWHKLRVFDPDRKDHPVVFGASEASMVMENPLELFLYKTGRKQRPEATEDMEVGSLMEPVVLEMYRRREGVVIETGIPLHFHGEHSFMAASPDAFAYEDIAKRKRWIADAKTSSNFMFLKEGFDQYKYGAEGTDQVPLYTLWQMQQLCEVFDAPFADVPVLFGRKYRFYRVHRDNQLIDVLVKAEKELAERIINDDPPEPTWSAPSTRECLNALYGMERGLAVPLSDISFARWLDVQKRKEDIKILQEANKADENQILAEMGQAELGIMPQGTAAVKRIVVRDSMWTEADIGLAMANQGQVKRAGHVRLMQVKVK